MTPAKILPHDPEAPDDGQLRIHAYQEEAIQRILSEPTKAALVASEVGRGKTLIASEVALRAGWKRVIWIIIPHTFDQWSERIHAQSDGAVTLRRMDSTKEGRAAFADFLAGNDGWFAAGLSWLQAQDWAHRDKLDPQGDPIPAIDKKTGEPSGKNVRERVHLQTFRKMSNRKKGAVDAVVVDESQSVANRDAVGRRTLLTFKTEWKIALSATPGGNSFGGIWSISRWLWPTEIPPFWEWSDRWCATESTYVSGGREVAVIVGERNPGEFVRSLPLFIKDEAEEKAPPAHTVYVDSTPEQRRQYDDLVDQLMTWARNFEGDHEPLVVDMPPILHGRLRQVALAELSFDEKGNVSFAPDAPSAKLKALRGILDHWGDQPVVIFTDSLQYANLVTARMKAAGYAAEAWTGEVNQKERKRLKAAFMAGEFQYLVATVQSAGTGTDGWQRVCSKIVWLSEPDGNPTLREQAEGRLFRPGRTLEHGEFCQVRIIMRDSVDTLVMQRLIDKARSLASSLSRDALLGKPPSVLLSEAS